MTREGQETKVFLSDPLTKPSDGLWGLFPGTVVSIPTPFVSSLLSRQGRQSRQAEGSISTALDSVYNHQHERKGKRWSLGLALCVA